MYKEHKPNYGRKEGALKWINHTYNNKNGTHIEISMWQWSSQLWTNYLVISPKYAYHCSNKSSFHSDTNSHLHIVYSIGLTGQNLQMYLYLSKKINRTLNCRENLVCDSPFKYEMQHPPPEKWPYSKQGMQKRNTSYLTPILNNGTAHFTF